MNMHSMKDVPWELLSHQLTLQLKGIYVPNLDNFRDSTGSHMFREFRLQFSDSTESTDPVSMKLTARPAANTPYAYLDNHLLYQSQVLSFPNISIYRIPIPLEEDLWHLKGYTFPFRGSRNPYRELRINLKISGYCPGKCLFCHRTHSHRIRTGQKRLPNASGLPEQIKQTEGDEIFELIDQVMVISELFGSEVRFLDALQHMANALSQAGYPLYRSFNCCATDVRSLDGLKRLLDIVRPGRYSFSLEFFQNREQWMGSYKGIPLKQVCTILENARQVGFTEIQLNYIAGIDSLEACQQGFSTLSRLGLVDSVGLSTLMLFAEDEVLMRANEAWQTEYYKDMVSILNDCHIKAYHPDSYDMGCPYTYLMEKTQ